jgi:hypothetical protein
MGGHEVSGLVILQSWETIRGKGVVWMGGVGRRRQLERRTSPKAPFPMTLTVRKSVSLSFVRFIRRYLIQSDQHESAQLPMGAQSAEEYRKRWDKRSLLSPELGELSLLQVVWSQVILGKGTFQDEPSAKIRGQT